MTVLEQPNDDRHVSVAMLLALVGLSSATVYLVLGFSEWTMGVGFWIGMPCLFLADVIYLVVVLRDLHQRKLI